MMGGLVLGIAAFFLSFYALTGLTKEDRSFILKQAKPAIFGCIRTKLGKEVAEEVRENVYQAREMLARDIPIPGGIGILAFFLGIYGVRLFYKKTTKILEKDTDEEAFEAYQKKAKKHTGLEVGGLKSGYILIDSDKDSYSKEQKEKEATLRKRTARLDKEDDLSHFLIIGQSGTGKTTLLYDIFTQLGDKRKIIHDNKMAIMEKFFNEKKDLIFNPMDERSLAWTIFNDIQTVADVESVAKSLIPDNPRATDPMWDDAARKVFMEALKHCIKKGKKTNQELYTLLSKKPLDIALEIDTPEIHSALSVADKTAAGIMTSLSVKFRPLAYLKDGDFSIKKWVRDDNAKGDIYITNRDDVADMIAPLLTLFIDLVSKTFLSLPDSRERRLYFLLDELGMLRKMSSIVRLITNSRSKGGSVMVGFQGISQIEEIYGNEAHTIYGCGTKFIFRIGEGRTADYISNFFGSNDSVKMDESYSVAGARSDDLNIRQHTLRESILDNSVLTNLPDRVCILKPKNFEYFFQIKSYVNPMPSINIGFIEREDLVLKEEEKIEEKDFDKNKKRSKK